MFYSAIEEYKTNYEGYAGESWLYLTLDPCESS